MRNKGKGYVAGLIVLICLIAASGCSRTESEGEKVTETPAGATTETPVKTTAETPATAEATPDEVPSKLPEHLPNDFPLPEDAVISTSHAEESDGKKSALLIFTTKQSMDSVTKLYKDYFASRKLNDAAETIDDTNLIIQGASTKNKDSWSMIGGLLSSDKETIELQVTWAEE